MATGKSLPPPRGDQAFWDISTLDAGFLGLREKFFVEPADPDKVNMAPSLAFLLTHSRTKERLLFDLGICKDVNKYPPVVLDWIRDEFPLEVKSDVADSLRRGGVEPDEIATIVFSHMHWDHTGEPAVFSRAAFVTGAGSRALLQNGYPGNKNSPFLADLLPFERTTFLDPDDGEWAPLGPFPRARDLRGDGSLFVVDAAGHLPGHINVIARNSATGSWVYLAGDSMHDVRILSGERAVADDPEGGCAHEHKEEAEVHIRRVREVMELPGVRVVLAHHNGWEVNQKEAYLPGKIAPLKL